MAEPGFVIKDFADYQKSWRDMEKAEAKAEREKVRGVGRIVQQDATALFSPFDDRSARGYKVRVRQRGVAVEQSLKRTTGLHPEFGSQQMRVALIPALERNEHELEKQLTVMLDEIARREGF